MDGFRRVDGKTITFWPEYEAANQVSDEMILELLREKQNARVCFHLSPEATQHDMLIAEWRALYTFPMHRHKKPEIIQIIRGSMNLRLMGTMGVVRHRLFRDGGIHIPQGIWHQTVPTSNVIVYREIKPGPFVPTDNELWTGSDPE